MKDGPGLVEKELRKLADAAGLVMRRPHKQDLTQFDEGGLWIAMVRYTFPAGGTALAEPFNHYVLVLSHLRDEGALVIADPHPSRPPLYCLSDASFEKAWDECAQNRHRRKWSARFYLKISPGAIDIDERGH
jgi:hypothetical protein